MTAALLAVAEGMFARLFRYSLLVALVLTVASPAALVAEDAPHSPRCATEDSTGCWWDCETMGNGRCAPGAYRWEWHER